MEENHENSKKKDEPGEEEKEQKERCQIIIWVNFYVV